ncbi:hypothetical protein PENTCL1PPCAC_21771 [Pristionchus entomophagus]|uniref:Membrane transporter n=1 Tax=Pristionchus entomophagus TaxID=358040 RepID=A0AAV5TZC4_9BILA|nr:hypothetical protein PENTCL1PPCAC_21770 [Pristionchus entomophagus]GMS99596.1 hypothetical protein PENTCL1PPCAC_21771 [Pristionchus entomophagus]
MKLYLISVATWIGFSLLSILLGSQSFLIFVVFRSLAAAASAVFGVLSPVVLADLFRDRALGIVLMLMTTCEQLTGSIISGIASSFIVSIGLPWQSGLLPGPLLSLIPLAGLLCCLQSVPRDNVQRNKNVCSGAFGVLSIKSFTIMTAGLALGAFHARAKMFWGPSIILSAWSYAPSPFLGLSYPSVTAIYSFIMLAGNLLGMPLILWFAQCWNHGTGPFSGRSGYAGAYPIVTGVGGLLNFAMYILYLLALDKSFAACLVPTFLVGVGSAAFVTLSQLMQLMVLPSHSRAAAIALSRMISGIVSTPSAQIVGFLSDTFRGDSTLDVDRFHAYQQAMMCSSLMLFVSAICFLTLIVFFERDCKRAEEGEGSNEQVEVNESTNLIEKSKSRSESVLSVIIRSRAQTFENFQ